MQGGQDFLCTPLVASPQLDKFAVSVEAEPSCIIGKITGNRQSIWADSLALLS
jgi:hypothetical protein